MPAIVTARKSSAAANALAFCDKPSKANLGHWTTA